jgi:hypothetical protein
MTSINALKFDDYSGVMVCDEQRGWGPEDMKIFTAYKIRPCVPPAIQKEYGLVAAYGNTGTSTIGDELKFNIKQRIQDEYDKEFERLGKKPKQFKTMDEIGAMMFDVITKMKHEHINQELKGKFGLTTKDFCRGFYMKDGQKVEIADKEVIRQVDEMLTWKSRGELARAVFLNGGIVAGYEPREGFRIFQYSMIEMFWAPVQGVFVADGSGCDTVNLKMADFANRKSIPERRGNIDPVDGLYAIIEAVNTASYHNIGVGGYYNIIWFNGRAKDNMKKMVEINDHRSKLASEIVTACEEDFISQDAAFKLLDDLIYQDKSYDSINDQLFKKTRNPKELGRFLRGYKV